MHWFGAKTNAFVALHLDDDQDALIVRSDRVLAGWDHPGDE